MRSASGIVAVGSLRLRLIVLSLSIFCGGTLMAATTTIRVRAADMGCRTDAICAIPSADGGLAQYFLQSSCPLSFTDPLPRGSVVTQIDLRASFANGPFNGDTGTAYFALNLQFYNQFERYIGSVAGPSTFPRCPPPGVPFQWSTVTGLPAPDGLPHYRSGLENSVHFWAVPTGGDPAGPQRLMILEMADIIIHYEPPPTIEFDITDSTSADDRKILIHRWREGTEHPYPSRFQRQLPGTANADRDRNIEISGTVRRSTGTPMTNQRVQLRVIDPPDDSPYVPVAARLPGDNGAFLGGTLRDTVVTTDGSGRFTTVLTGSEIAGDNYRVEASTVAGFGFSSICNATNNCYRSGVITNWKRIYLESDRMFRRGAYLTEDVGPCLTAPCYLPLTSLRGIHPNRTLRVVHAPRQDLVGPQMFYAENVQVLSVDRRNDRVEVTPFQNWYFGPDRDPGGTVQAFLADAVGLISGNDAEDFFTSNTQLIAPLFEGTFVEHVFLRDDPVPYLPFEEELLGDASFPNSEVTALARRWFLNADRAGSNHQHLLAGSTHFDDTMQGLTTSRTGTNWSWVFVQTTAGSSPRRGGGEWAFNGEVTGHELAHQWQVNDAPGGGHCTAFRWNSTSQYCSMHGNYGVADSSCQATCPEFYDGLAGFHYLSANDSEYMTIRRRPDPLPQF